MNLTSCVLLSRWCKQSFRFMGRGNGEAANGGVRAHKLFHQVDLSKFARHNDRMCVVYFQNGQLLQRSRTQ